MTRKPRFEPVEIFVVVSAWFAGVSFGALTALALTQTVTGHAVVAFNPKRIDWSISEARILGLAWAIFGLSGGLGALVGGVVMSAHLTPPFWWWVPFCLAAMAVLVFQGTMEQRHHTRWPINRTGPPVH
jgi:hypothetical protein